MEDFKCAAKRAKRRLKSGYWEKCKREAESAGARARRLGLNENKVKAGLYDKVRSDIRGEKPDDFYLRVKKLLDEYGEVSDAIGRLTDHDYYATLSYAEKQRYNLQLSEKYLKALEKYRREKQMTALK